MSGNNITMPFLSLSRRVRRTPFTNRVEGAGVKGYTIYNRMRLPTFFATIEEDYRHLKSKVQVWDVSCERQVEVRGKGAAAFLQKLTPRSLAKMSEDQCFYTPMVDQRGGMLNDPVTVPLEEDRYWVSLADSDMLLWIQGLAVGMGLELEIFEPDVSPLAIQGPLADDLAAAVFGEKLRSLKFFRYTKVPFAGREFLIARSGYSKQGGFEIYVEGSENGEAVWDALFEAGKSMEVRAGCPNLIERVEGGLLSYGNDMTSENTPLECGLGKFCDEEAMHGCIGGPVLMKELKEGPAKIMKGYLISGGRIPPCTEVWPITCSGRIVGQVTSAAWSPDLGTSIGLGIIDRAFAESGTVVEVNLPGEKRAAKVTPLPFI